MAISEYEVFGASAGTAYVTPIRIPPVVRCAMCGRNPTMPRSSHCADCEHAERLQLRRMVDNQQTLFEIFGKATRGAMQQ